ncbi:DoxX family protein [Planctomyces sp. SH-PL14]|uniref:DoxX family protein n=1 Tax=Planctomyces sp. SH-PL14 TaxID=1632864 RepID=UPI00078C08D9|nr:DoxX family protein [Planctomyces sp. SH-PL14]AMV20063.1 Inner membrane protein YqjF [Planctomyces sp. SH-PL14]
MSAGSVLRSLAVGGGGGTLVTDIGLLIVRVGFGSYMAVAHGLGKFKNLSGMTGYLQDLGLPMPGVMSATAGIVEFFGAIFLAIGIVTRPAATALAGTMCVAAFVAHKNDPFFAAPGARSREMAMLYLFVFVLFMLAGGGRFSLDYFLRKRG